MRKYLLILICFIFVLSNIRADEKDLIKRNVMILPFYNQNSVKEFDYLKDILRDALKSELLNSNNFIFTNFSDINDQIENSGENINYFIEEKNATLLAAQLKADVVVIGKYIIIDEKIMILIQAVDIFTRKTAASTNITGNTGLDVFTLIQNVSVNMAGKMNNTLKPVEKSYFDKMVESQKKNEVNEKYSNLEMDNEGNINIPIKSVSASAYSEKNFPENAIDKNMMTKWHCLNSYSQWIIFNFDNKFDIKYIKIVFDLGNEVKHKFKIYREDLTKKEKLKPQYFYSSGKSSDYQIFKIDNYQNNYLKIITDGSDRYSGFNIIEIEVWGKPVE